MGKVNKVLPQKTTLLSFFHSTSTSSKSKITTVPKPTNGGSKGTEKQNERSDQMTTPVKRSKFQDSEIEMCDEQNNSTGEASTPTPLTPEQKKMIHNKGLSAKLLKCSHTLQVLDQQMGPSWFSALEGEFKKDYFRELNDFLMSARNRATVFPPHPHVWEWTKQTEINDIRVVILGQDPYHGPNQAHGLCFSVKKGVAPPPSLVNMYKELESDIPGFKIPNHGCLSGWSEQGVLLLNAVLTVESGKANAHKDKGWEKITDAVISWISRNLDSVVFLLWGAYAQKKAAIVDKRKHHLLQAVHPSPLSAHRGFIGCKHFSKCNQLLVENGKLPIDWNHLP